MWTQNTHSYQVVFARKKDNMKLSGHVLRASKMEFQEFGCAHGSEWRHFVEDSQYGDKVKEFLSSIRKFKEKHNMGENISKY